MYPPIPSELKVYYELYPELFYFLDEKASSQNYEACHHKIKVGLAFCIGFAFWPLNKNTIIKGVDNTSTIRFSEAQGGPAAPNESISVLADTTGRFRVTVREETGLRTLITQPIELEIRQSVPTVFSVEYHKNGALEMKVNGHELVLDEEAKGIKRYISALKTSK